MALKFKGTVDVLPTEGVAVNDAYYWTDKANQGASAGYRYCSAISGSSITWSSYVPVKVIDDLALSTTYEGSGAPTTTSNAVQFPTLGTGDFYLDGASGAVYAYIDPSGWQPW
jgi:hypothetical protein